MSNKAQRCLYCPQNIYARYKIAIRMEPPSMIYLYGWGGCGKSVLKRLLDGHQQLAVTPDHDTLINTFALDNVRGEIKDPRGDSVDIESLRGLLNNSKYYFLQRVYEGIPSWMPTSANDQTAFDFEGFDFYEFEREWVKKVNQDRDYTPENILYRILQTLFEEWKPYEYNETQCDYFVGTGCKRKYPMRYLLETVQGSKVIFAYRDPRGIISTEGTRSKKDHGIDARLRSGEIFEILEQYTYAKLLKSKNPNRVHIVSFEDFILETSQTMPDIANFLEIDYDPILKKATFAGRDIETSSGESYIGEINDDWRDIMSPRQKKIATLQLGESSLSDSNPMEIYTYGLSYANLYKKTLKERVKTIRKKFL
jgi:hypothetical protein